MKKLLMLVFSLTFVVLLTGCGNEIKTAVCDHTDATGNKITFDVSATNNFSNQNFEDLVLEKDTYDGLKITIEFDDEMTVTFDADLKVADKELLKKVGMDFEGKDMDIDRFVENIEEEGYTCK